MKSRFLSRLFRSVPSACGRLTLIGALSGGALSAVAGSTGRPLDLLSAGLREQWRCQGKCFSGAGAIQAKRLELPLGPSSLACNKPYRLRLEWAGATVDPASVQVIFKQRSLKESFRTYGSPLKSGENTLELEFSTPAFCDAGEIVLTGGGDLHLRSATLAPRVESRPVVAEPVPSAHVPSGYRLVFHDEFNANTLDRSKWFTRYIYESEKLDHLKDEAQRYSDRNNHQLANGALSLVARRETDGSISSGMIRSDWVSTYGYYEARVKMPRGKGVFPAFWLNSDVSPAGDIAWPPEIDIFEFVNNGREEKPDMIHFGAISQPGAKQAPVFAHKDFNTQWNYWRAPFAFDEGWHVVSLLWTPEAVSYYVDGEKILERPFRWTRADGSVAPAAHIILNLAVGGSWAGRYGIDEAMPFRFEVDWVRVYQPS